MSYLNQSELEASLDSWKVKKQGMESLIKKANKLS